MTNRSPFDGMKPVARVIVALLVIGMICPSVSSQTIEGRGEDDEMSLTPQVIQAQGSLQTPLEGPIDPAHYVLGPSDQILVILKGPETSMHYLRVFPEGNVILPNYGAFQASGMTLATFTERIREVLRKYYRNVEIDVQLSVPRVFQIYVLGEVRNPGPVSITAVARVSDALRMAGGPSDTGSTRLVEIRENGTVVRRSDQFLFLQEGDFEQNPTVQEGMMIYVPLKETTVTVIGEVRRTGRYEIVHGETAADLIAFCGGIGPLGDSKRIIRESIRNGKPQPVATFSLQEADTVHLTDMDVVVVDNALSYDGAPPVQVVGGGGRTGVFEVAREEPLQGFLYRLWRIDPASFDIESAVLESPAGDGTTSVQTKFNVRAVLAGTAEDTLVVRPGDFVVIPPAPRNVFVTGEVMLPGPVPFQPGLKAEHYVTLAGGPNASGSYGKLKLISLDGETRDGNRNSEVYRGDTVVVGVKTSKIWGSIWVGIVSVTGLAVALVALSNSVKD